MLIIPAIDLQNGKCVRLAQGRFEDVTQYGDPLPQLAVFAGAGARWVHVVDLDGARLGQPAQHDAIGRLAANGAVLIQSGGGVRERAHVEALLSAGVARVVIGSAAIRRPDDVAAWIADFGLARICCAFDVREVDDGFEVVIDGWTRDGGVSLERALDFYPPGALRHILVTDISRDGVLTGPNVALMHTLARLRPDLKVQASGGVATLDDLAQLRTTGAAAAIVGRALYEKRFSLEAALAG